MKFHQNFNEMAIRPYGRGYQAPSTALFNTDRAVFEIAGEDESIQAFEIIKMPDFIEIVVELSAIPLPVEQNYTATYKFDEITWPTVPLYPIEETQFVRALELLYTGVIKIRNEHQFESNLVYGKNIEGFEIKLKEGEAIYTYSFDYQNESIDFSVIQKREIVPVWPVGGFYRPGCQIDQIQQVFCSLSEQDRQTFARKTLLYQWNEQGFYPPMTNVVDEQQTVFQTPRLEPYIKFMEDICQGKVRLDLVDPRELNPDQVVHFTYRSIDIKDYGLNKAIIYFAKI